MTAAPPPLFGRGRQWNCLQFQPQCRPWRTCRTAQQQQGWGAISIGALPSCGLRRSSSSSSNSSSRRTQRSSPPSWPPQLHSRPTATTAGSAGQAPRAARSSRRPSCGSQQRVGFLGVHVHACKPGSTVAACAWRPCMHTYACIASGCPHSQHAGSEVGCMHARPHITNEHAGTRSTHQPCHPCTHARR